MLGKMIKYEFKQIRFIFLLMIVFILAVTGFALLFGIIPLLNRSYDYISDLGSVMLGLSVVIYILVIFAVSVGISIYVGLRFYKTMYSNGGYLTHTLPVTAHELLLGKLIPTGLCILLLGFFTCISVFIVLGGYMLGVSFTRLGEVMEALREIIPTVVTEFHNAFNMDLSVFIVIVLINILLGIFAAPLLIYVSVSIGQLFNTHRVLMSVIAYIGLNILITTVSSIIGAGFNTATFMLYAESIYILPSMILSTAQNILMVVFSYMGCYFIIKNRLNLE